MSLTRRLAIATLALCCAGFVAHVSAQAPTPKKGTIGGRVTIKGKPAPGVTIAVRTSPMGSPFEPTFRGVTDHDGNYRVVDVPTGSYQVEPIALAYVVVPDRNSPRRQSVVVTENENIEGIDFALVRGGVITGKVTYADGHPVVEQRVTLHPAESPSLNRPASVYTSAIPVAASLQTDDRGIYRFFGVPEGRFRVSAGQTSDDSVYVSVGGVRPTYKQIFAPDTEDINKATVIEVKEGSEASNVDISLGHTAQTYSASGRVADAENDQPVINAGFMVQAILDEKQRRYAVVGTSANSNSKGEFRIEGLPPGKYALSLISRLDSEIRSEPLVFDVIDQDVGGLLMKTARGASVSGNIMLENTDDKALWAKLTEARVNGIVRNQTGYGGVLHTSLINADGSFRISGLDPGIVNLSINFFGGGGPPKGFTISRIERDGVVQPRGIEAKPGEQISGVRLIISYGAATVRGMVRQADGTFPPGTQVFVRVSKQGEPNLIVRPFQVDSRGHFVIEGLSAGVYDFETRVLTPRPRGKPRPPVKQQLTVLDDSTNDLTITIDLSPEPGTGAP